MKRRQRFTTGQINTVMAELDAGTPVAALCRKYGVSDTTIYAWKARHRAAGEGHPCDGVLAEENARLRRLLADALLDNALLKAQIAAE